MTNVKIFYWFLLIVTILFSSIGCSSHPIGSPENEFDLLNQKTDKINFPSQYSQKNALFFVSNEIEINAKPEKVWEILIDANNWQNWYKGASNLTLNNPVNSMLGAESSINWTTMDMDFVSKITEFYPPNRLSWESRKCSIQGYHGWILIPTQNGTKVITEEGFQGILGWLQSIFIPGKLHKLHDLWLQELKKKSEV
jgi:uncharacterized protein YndB with AHSA1/START domain